MSTEYPLFLALADNVAFAQNKHHISIFNTAGSKRIIRLEKLHMINTTLASVTGVCVRFDARRSTAQSGGTIIAPTAYDSADASKFDAGAILISTGATVTNGVLRYPVITNNDEVGTTAATLPGLVSRVNVFTAEGDQKRGVLRPGEGFTVQQITSSTVGTFSWLLQFSIVKVLD